MLVSGVPLGVLCAASPSRGSAFAVWIQIRHERARAVGVITVRFLKALGFDRSSRADRKSGAALLLLLRRGSPQRTL